MYLQGHIKDTRDLKGVSETKGMVGHEHPLIATNYCRKIIQT